MSLARAEACAPKVANTMTIATKIDTNMRSTKPPRDLAELQTGCNESTGAIWSWTTECRPSVALTVPSVA